MMHYRMHQYIQPRSFPGRNRYDRNMPEHLRKSVQINLHAPVFDYIHHIESQDDRLLKLQQLKR